MRRITALLALGLALTTACGMSDATSPSGSLQGTYALRSINGAALPYRFANGLQLTSETLTLNGDGSYNAIGRYSDGSTTTEVGYYTAANNAITFNDQTDNFVYQGSISGNVLTQITGGFTAVYQKN